MQKQMMPVGDFLDHYLISRTEFYRQVNQGKIRLIKRGRRSFVTAQDAQDWFDGLDVYAPKKKMIKPRSRR